MRPTKISDRIRRASAGGSKVALSPQTAADSTQEPLKLFRYRMELISPMLGGGARDKNSGGGGFDAHHPIRATGIRAQLRQWWRAGKDAASLLLDQAAAEAAQQSSREAVSADELLHEQEVNLFGGLRRGQPVASRIRIRVIPRRIRWGQVELYDSYLKQPPKDKPTIGVNKYIGHALAAGKAEQAEHRPRHERDADRAAKKKSPELVEPPMLREGTRFDLLITCTRTDHAHIFPALQAFANFGGIGARTRRGFGAVFCEALAYTEAELRAKVGDLRAEWPTLARRIELFDIGLEQAHHLLWKFRQAPGFARRNGSGKRPGESYWPEAGAVRSRWQSVPEAATEASSKPPAALQGHRIWPFSVPWNSEQQFDAPRIGFGLPLIVHLRNEYSVPVAKANGRHSTARPASQEIKEVIVPLGGEGGRWASPLILRPVRLKKAGEATATWRNATVFLLLHSPAPPEVRETVVIPGRDNFPPRRAVLQAQEFVRNTAGDEARDSRIVKYLAQASPPGDAVQAFLDFAVDEILRRP